MFLIHLKHGFSLLEAPTLALFSRDKHQKGSGNPFHEHGLEAVDKSKLPQGANNYLEELCRTSMLEIIKTEEIQPLIDQGLVRDR